MADYQTMYSTLFNAITDALRQIEQENFDAAAALLVQAQQSAEERYLDSTE